MQLQNICIALELKNYYKKSDIGGRDVIFGIEITP